MPGSGCYDKAKSETYFKGYLANAEPGIKTQLLQIDMLFRNADYKGIIAKIKEVQASMPTEAPNRLQSMAAMAYFAEKDYPNTIQCIENYLAALGKEDEIITFHYKSLAISYSETGNYAKAVKAYLNCAEIQKDTFLKMGYMDNAAAEAIKAKDYATACALYSNIFDAKKSPGASDYFKLGSAYYNAGNCEESKRIFSVYADKFPNDWRPPLYIGYCEAKQDPYMTMGNAIPYYNKFIELAKNETTAKKSLIHTHMYLFAYEYQIKKNTAAAVAHLESVLALDPENEDALKYKTLLVK
jgi:tetratricopeptide (TPR) repeat protein